MQRPLIIAVAALLVIGLGVGAYFLFFYGSPKVSITIPGDTTLPIAGGIPSSSTGTGTSSGTPTIPSPASPVTVTSRLVEISAGPVVPGEVITDTKVPGSASSTLSVALVSYIERQSGNIFSYHSDTHVLTRINNKTLPGIQSAAWLPNASLAFVRYLSGTDFGTINTYALSASSSAGFFLPQNLSDVAVSSTSVLALASGVTGSIGTLTHTDGTHGATVFTTPLTSLRIAFAGKSQYLAFTKPSATLAGDAFLITNGRFSRIAGPLNGLAALPSPSGKWALVSYVQNTLMQLELVNTATNEAISLPIGTIADKCVWSSDEKSVYCAVPQNPSAGTYPDDWYQGVAHFSDRIWSIHVADRYAQMILDFSQANKGALDAAALAVDPSGTTLVFINTIDDSLWSYSL